MDYELRIDTFSGTWVGGPQQQKRVVTIPLCYELLYWSRTSDIGDQDRWGFVLDEAGPLIWSAGEIGYRWFKLQVDKRAIWIHSGEIFERLCENRDMVVVLAHTDDMGIEMRTEWQETEVGVHLLDVQIVLRA
tara:strand:+ start:9281 stop:9679 length:399 start_codon:yes stop_codon:yes gene_type:complete